MWSVKGQPVPTAWIDFTPIDVLYKYDGPRTFTCRDRWGNLYLAHWCDEDQDVARFLLVEFSETLLASLITGEIDVRDGLSRSKAWVFDLDDDFLPVQAWRVDTDDLPREVLPRRGVMLWKHLPRLGGVSLRTASKGAEVVRFAFPNYSSPRLRYADQIDGPETMVPAHA